MSPIIHGGGSQFKLKPPRSKREVTYEVEIEFEGRWEVEQGSMSGFDSIEWRHDYYTFGSGPTLSGRVCLFIKGATEAEAVEKAIKKVEESPSAYPGFLRDADAYTVTVRLYRPYGGTY